jgi:hypothetical protein
MREERGEPTADFAGSRCTHFRLDVLEEIGERRDQLIHGYLLPDGGLHLQSPTVLCTKA